MFVFNGVAKSGSSRWMERDAGPQGSACAFATLQERPVQVPARWKKV